MNLNKHDSETEMEMNMTPMIDVVFLLIIFFMIITDLTQQELEDLELPLAVEAAPDKPNPEEWRPIINIDHNGRMVVKRNDYYDPEKDQGPRKYDRLKIKLLDFAKRMKKEPLPELGGKLVPDEPILLRADRSSNFRFVQDIMEQCGDQSIAIWKLQLAVSVPEENQ